MTRFTNTNAQIGTNVQIAATAIIGDSVTIGDNSSIADYAIIRNGVSIGANCKIYPHVIIGEDPQDFSFTKEATYVEIGNNNVFREFVTVHKAVGADNKTCIGDNNFFMVSSHVGHNCIIGHNNTFANGVQLAGYVEISDHVTIGGLTAIHQHCRVGDYAMISGLSATNKDLPPYFIYGLIPAVAASINRRGLQKAGFSQELRNELLKAFKIIYKSREAVSTSIVRLESELHPYPEIQNLIKFLKSSKRGIKTSRYGEE
jgi:UDP-N-acetylglucosamine acyltransferase